MSLKIGLDIDGVVADSFVVFRRELNKHYGKEITKFDDYDMSKLYNVAWEDMSAFFAQNMEYLFSTPVPMDGAVATIHAWLREGHEIFYITARKCGAEERVTLKWFDQNNIPRAKAVFVGEASKTFAVKQFAIDIFVEDYLGNALEIAAAGVPVLLLDAPYNRGKTPRGVTRCYNWKEIKARIDDLAKIKEPL